MKFSVSSDKNSLQLDRIQYLLSQTFWAKDRAKEQIIKSIEYSLCFGAYLQNGTQIAFARAVTDYASSYYVCDVVVEEAYRGNGIGTALVQSIVEDPRLDGLRGILVTSHAQTLYQKFGFETDGERLMERKPRKRKE